MTTDTTSRPTQPGHPAMDSHNEYQWKLWSKLAHHITWCTIPEFVATQCKLVSGWGLKKRRSTLANGSTRLAKYFTLFRYYNEYYITTTTTVLLAFCLTCIWHIFWSKSTLSQLHNGISSMLKVAKIAFLHDVFSFFICQGPSTYYITLGRWEGVDNLLYALYGGGGLY